MATVKRLRQGAYQVKWNDKTAEGKRTSRTEVHPTRAIAEDRKAEIEGAKRHRTYRDPRRADVAFGPYLMESLDRADLAQGTRDNYRQEADHWIVPKLGDRTLASIDVEVLESFYAEVARKAGRPTVEQCRKVLAIAFRRATRGSSRLLDSNPLRESELPKDRRERQRKHAKRLRVLETEQVERLADEVGAHGDGRYRALVPLMAYAGLRSAEAFGLRVGNLDLDAGTISVVEQMTESRGRLTIGAPLKTDDATDRSNLRIPESLVAELRAHLARFPTGLTGLVFTTPSGDPIRRSNFRRQVFDKAVERARVPAITPHDLRHTCASQLFAAGVPSTVVAAYLGHSIRVCERTYRHMIPSKADAAALALDAVLGGRVDEVAARRRKRTDG
jgi:integrase